MTLLPDRTRQTAAAYALRIAVLLVSLFILAETPLGTGSLFGHSISFDRGLSTSELPVRFATRAETRGRTLEQAVVKAAEQAVPDGNPGEPKATGASPDAIAHALQTRAHGHGAPPVGIDGVTSGFRSRAPPAERV